MSYTNQPQQHCNDGKCIEQTNRLKPVLEVSACIANYIWSKLKDLLLKSTNPYVFQKNSGAHGANYVINTKRTTGSR